MRDVTVYLDEIAFLRELAEGEDGLIVTLTSIDDGTMLWVSPDGLRSVLGYEPDDVVGAPAPELLAGRAQSRRFGDELAMVGNGATVAGWYEAKHKTGHPVPLRVTAWVIAPDVAVSLAVPDGDPRSSDDG